MGCVALTSAVRMVAYSSWVGLVLDGSTHALSTFAASANYRLSISEARSSYKRKASIRIEAPSTRRA
jgi:hypothetical protein